MGNDTFHKRGHRFAAVTLNDFGRMMVSRFFLAVILPFFSLGQVESAEKIQVFLLSGQSNMAILVRPHVITGEVQLLKVGISNQSYHYWGSTKFYAQAGKAFAEAMVHMNTK